MNLIAFKILAAIIILLAALLAGLLPARVTSTQQRFFILGDAFASGVFLGAGAFHMLPDAWISFSKISPHPYLYTIVLCLGGILLLALLENITRKMAKSDTTSHPRLTGYLLALVLSIHSLIEGAALGVNTLFADALLIFIAIIAHKGSASFALGVTLRRTLLSRTATAVIVIIFSFMTPLGTLLATTASLVLKQESGQILEASFNAFAAGTFLYIGGIRVLESNFIYHFRIRYQEVVTFFSGIFLMGFVAIFV